MFVITEDNHIYLTRGDVATIVVTASNSDNTPFEFQPGNTVGIKVFKKGDCNSIVINKTVVVETEPTTSVSILLTSSDTTIGDIINSPVTFWYEIELITTDDHHQTIIGYDSAGPKLFKLYPEGGTI